MEKVNTRDVEKAAIIKKTARICTVSDSLVQKVIRGDRDNEIVLSTFMILRDIDNSMVEAVKKMLPFDLPYKGVTQEKLNTKSIACSPITAN
ncbi:hypothetical protein [Limnovirga soli]|uniref:Uncharacterized protein n=1 Tax=Limnovirga soli TaxID=2656915 RepID=A0A8J8FBM0_9BACT|nr:hypothetical protein [Limnovirga soli]NNV54567.1 hypothetical protein [Limnovirga soli]